MLSKCDSLPRAPLVSVIIATRNEEKNIERLIQSVRAQTYSNIEVIVIDNDSSDQTCLIADRLGVRTERFPLSSRDRQPKNFRGAQVNLGVSLTTADMTFDKDLINDAVALLETFDALYVPEVVVGHGLFGRVRNFERSFYVGTVIDAVRFCRRLFFYSIGGFDEQNICFGADDWDLTRMLKKREARVSTTSKVLFHHEEHLRLSTYLDKKRQYSATFDAYIDKWGREDPEIKQQFGFFYRFIWVFVENGKWRKVFDNVGLFMCLIAVRALVGVQFLRGKAKAGLSSIAISSAFNL